MQSVLLRHFVSPHLFVTHPASILPTTASQSFRHLDSQVFLLWDNLLPRNTLHLSSMKKHKALPIKKPVWALISALPGQESYLKLPVLHSRLSQYYSHSSPAPGNARSPSTAAWVRLRDAMKAITGTTAPKIHVQRCSSHTKRTLSSPKLYKRWPISSALSKRTLLVARLCC